MTTREYMNHRTHILESIRNYRCLLQVVLKIFVINVIFNFSYFAQFKNLQLYLTAFFRSFFTRSCFSIIKGFHIKLLLQMLNIGKCS